MNKPIGAIDGDKFVGRMESIRDNARTIYARNAYNFVLDEVRSYIIPSDQGEVTRLREALIWYADHDNYLKIKRLTGDPHSPIDCDVLDDNGERARQALSSSHREDGKQPKMTHNDQFQLACLVKEYGAEAIIRLIPGITEER